MFILQLSVQVPIALLIAIPLCMTERIILIRLFIITSFRFQAILKAFLYRIIRVSLGFLLLYPMAEMKQFGIDLELDDTVAQGHYSNLAIISHSTSEFIIDFAAVLPGVQKARVKSRIILTPEHAKRLLRSLQENIVRYESNVGKIEIPTPPPVPEAGPKMGEA